MGKKYKEISFEKYALKRGDGLREGRIITVEQLNGDPNPVIPLRGPLHEQDSSYISGRGLGLTAEDIGKKIKAVNVNYIN